MSSLVGDVMARNVISVREQAQYEDIVVVMRERGFSAMTHPAISIRPDAPVAEAARLSYPQR